MASIKLKGDTSGEVTISAPAVAGTTTLTLPTTSSTLATYNSLGVRNLIINGDMRIAQRGTSVSEISSGGYYTIDRLNTNIPNINGGTWTMSQDTDVPTGQGFSYSVKYQCTTVKSTLDANSLMQIHSRNEGQFLQHLKWGSSNAESLTLSFWVKSNKTGTYIAELYSQETQIRTIAKSYTIDTANTWEKKTLTFDGDTVQNITNDNNTRLHLLFGLLAGTDFSSGTLPTSWQNLNQVDRYAGQVNLADSTSNYINLTGVQLEVGTEATPFEHRPYDMELARCQRYFQILPRGIGTGFNSTTIARVSWSYNTSMRASPTLAAIGTPVFLTGSVNVNLSVIGTNYSTINGAQADLTTTSGVSVNNCCVELMSPSTYFTASAEL